MTSFCQFSALVQKGKSDSRSAFYVSQEEGMYNWAQIPGIGNRMFFFFFTFIIMTVSSLTQKLELIYSFEHEVSKPSVLHTVFFFYIWDYPHPLCQELMIRKDDWIYQATGSHWRKCYELFDKLGQIKGKKKSCWVL